jgi:hypothetical protein
MKILQLTDDLHDYLVHVLKNYSASGINPQEGLAIYHLWNAVTKDVQHIDPAKLTQIQSAQETNPNG